MKNNKRKVEVLAPAGAYESLVAAVNAGADAVYIGGSRFGARAYADNPDEDRLIQGIEYAHLHGSSVYLTVNTLVRDEEIDELYDYLNPYYKNGLDAVIVQDLGVFHVIKECFPDLPIHASTQMTITGVNGARALKEMGAARVVTARELSLEEIAEIHRQVEVEIESFVHGALCYCYSGQCLFSSLIGGRSGNRGRCAQPCRLPYDVSRNGKKLNSEKERYLLSLKDLCTLDLIPDLIEAGVYSMKIEGRMKSPRYTAGVVSAYRKYVDKYLNDGRDGFYVEPEDKKMLLDLFDRGGQTDGYYTRHNGRDMVVLKEKPSFREGNQKLFDYLDETYVNGKNQEPVRAKLTLKTGEPSQLFLEGMGAKAEVWGDVVQQALRQPLTADKIAKQIKKTGGTPFYFDTLDIETKGDVFLPVQALNDLRRMGLDRLEAAVLGQFMREGGCRDTRPVKKWEGGGEGFRIQTLLERPDTLKSVLEFPEVSEVFLDSTGFDAAGWKTAAEDCHRAGKKCLLALPHIFRKEAEQYLKEKKELMQKAGFDGVLVRNLEEAEFLRSENLRFMQVFDHSVYAYNRFAREELMRQGADRLTLPVELNSRELARLGCEGSDLLVYGYLPMMLSAQCIRKTMEGCSGKPETLYLKDRMGKEMPVKNICRFCYNIFYNSTPLSLFGDKQPVKKLNPGGIRLSFTIESPSEVRQITGAFVRSWVYGEEGTLPEREYTRGHFKRGVE